MKLDRPLRIALAIAIAVGLLLVLVALLLLTESVLEVWRRLSEAPGWLVALWLGAVGALTLASGWAVLRLLFPRRAPLPPDETLDQASLEARIERADALGIDASAARRELQLLASRRATGDFRVAVFGEISTGKSAVIAALLPAGAEVSDISVRGGSTRQLTDYQWKSPAGDQLILTDIPGLNEADGRLDAVARDEAMRAHAVVYVCDNDLTREQFATLSALDEYRKPMLVALNKTDRLTREELAAVRERVSQRLATLKGSGQPVRAVAISAAPRRKVVRMTPQAGEETMFETGAAQVDELREALQSIMDRDPVLIEELRDANVFILARRHLDTAETEYRTRRGEELVQSYTRKAIVGALAAVAPGTDVLIQGYLGANLVRELCELHGVTARDIDVQQFLKLSQKHIGKAMPLLLAIGGNALKAFPGAGTVAGGLMHAVAYGLIFDALGHALTRTLTETGRLRPAPAAARFKELLGENIQKRTTRMAKLALDASTRRDDS